MTTSTSLRKTLRCIPTFRNWPSRELDRLAMQMVYKEYEPGNVLWRSGVRLDFFGIVQKGEVVVEYKTTGANTRSARLVAGNFFGPLPGTDGSVKSAITARAATRVILYVLPLEMQTAFNPNNTWPTSRNSKPMSRRWMLIVGILALLLTYPNLISILNGTLCLLSDRAWSNGDIQQALHLLEIARYLDANSELAYNQAGYLWFQMDDAQRARELFNQATSVAPSGASYNNSAVIHLLSGEIERAAKLQQAALDLEPDTAVIRYNQGLLMMAQQDWASAIQELKDAIHLAPNWNLPHAQLSYAYLQIQESGQAEVAARRAIDLSTDQPSVYLTLAIALYSQKKSSEALTIIREAIELMPEDVVARFYECLILHDLGMNGAALAKLETLLNSVQDPDLRARIVAEIEGVRWSVTKADLQNQKEADRKDKMFIGSSVHIQEKGD